MAKKQEDNRDVFEKALDYAVPAAGAYVGMVAGRRLGGSKKRAQKYFEERDAARRKRDSLIESKHPKQGDAEEVLWQENKRTWANEDGWRQVNGRVHGGMAGATAGAVGGMVLQDGNRPGKRRR